MSELSVLYTQDTSVHYSAAELTYEWANPNSGQYYQSFQTTEKGTIDQSIFVFKRKNDKYSFGNVLSVPYVDNAGMHFAKYVNGFKKNNNCIAFPQINSYGTVEDYVQNPNDFADKNMYSPGAAHLSAYSNQNRFYININYNGIVLYCRCDGYYNDGTHFTDTALKQIMTDALTHGRAHITWVQALPYFTTYAGSSFTRTVGQEISVNFLQFVGTMNKFDADRTGNFIKNCRITDTKTGVFLTNWTTNLFMSIVHNLENNSMWYNQMRICPYDIEAITHQFTVPNTQNVYYCLDVEDVVAMMDSLGFNWTNNVNSAMYSEVGAHCTDDDIRCPVIDPTDNSITDTVYSGQDIAFYAYLNPDSNYNWDTGAIDYDGKTFSEARNNSEPEQSTVEETEEIKLNAPVLATTGGNTMWLLSEIEIREFFKLLWGADGTPLEDLIAGLAMLGTNPMDFIVSLKLYPIKNLINLVSISTGRICFGKYESDMVGKAYITSSNIIILDLGDFYFNDGGLTNDFRDYEPYSKYSLYIPFCGIVALNAVECINQTIDVKMIIDLSCGACTAVVYTNGVPYKYVDGSIGSEIMVTGRNMAAYGQTILGAALGGTATATMIGNKAGAKAYGSEMEQKGARIKEVAAANASFLGGDATGRWGLQAAKGGGMQVAGASIASGAAFAVAGAAISGTAAALMNAPNVDKVGSSVPAVALAEPLYCYFIVQRSDCWFPENYEKLYGRPLNRGGKVKDFIGFSTFGNLKVENIANATPEEIKLITELLTSGVYI